MGLDGAPAGYLSDWSATGTGANAKIGIILVHGYTGSPASVRPWAEYLHNHGYSVRTPLLPGHGTEASDLNLVKWQEWPQKIEKELAEMSKSCESIFMADLSMGGGTTLYIAQKHGDKLTGIILVNPMIHVAFVTPTIAYALSRFQKMRKSVGDDIKRPNVTEFGYDALPTRGLHQLIKFLKITRANLAKVSVPLQLFHSVDDHTLPVSNTEIVMAGVSSTNKSRIDLVNSYHVATLDYDAELIFQNSKTFIETLTKEAGK